MPIFPISVVEPLKLSWKLSVFPRWIKQLWIKIFCLRSKLEVAKSDSRLFCLVSLKTLPLWILLRVCSWGMVDCEQSLFLLSECERAEIECEWAGIGPSGSEWRMLGPILAHSWFPFSRSKEGLLAVQSCVCIRLCKKVRHFKNLSNSCKSC